MGATYGIRWGDGRTTAIGEDLAYAEQLLKEASGPFSRFEPAPAVVEVYPEGAASCIRCREVEPNSFLLGNNHGGAIVWRDGMCMAQSLTQAHVSYDTAILGHSILPRRNWPTPPTTERGRAAAIAELRRDIDRAAVLWSHRDDAGWLDDARRVLAIVDPPAPVHHQVPESEALTLFGGAA